MRRQSVYGPPTMLTLTAIALLCFGRNASSLSVSGVVLDMSEKPVYDRAIGLIPAEPGLDMEESAIPPLAYTDHSGYFHFSNVVQGVYYISVLPAKDRDEQSAIENLQYELVLVSLATNDITNLTLRPRAVSRFDVHGRVRSAKTGAPLSATLSVISTSPHRVASDILANPNLLKSIELDENGCFIKHNLAADKYMLRITIRSDTENIKRDLSIDISLSETGDVVVLEQSQKLLESADIDLNLWGATCESETSGPKSSGSP